MLNRLLPRIAATILVVLAAAVPAGAQDAIDRQPARIAEASPTPTAREAMALQGSQQWRAAADAWAAILDADPDNGQATFNLGYCLHLGGRLEEALEMHLRAVRFPEYRGIALYNVACAKALLGEPDAAIEALVASRQAGFDIGAARDDGDFDSMRGDPRLNTLLADSGRPGLLERARRLAGQAQAMYAAYAPQVRRELEGAVASADQQARVVMAQLMQDPRFAPLASRVLRFVGGQEAVAETPAATVREPATVEDAPSLRRAQRLQQSEDWSGAAQEYARLLESDPGQLQALFGHSYCLHMAGEYEAAIEAHQLAAAHPQLEGIALYNLGCAYALTGRPDEAFDALKASHAAGFEIRDHIETDADLKSLREDPRFTQLVVLANGGL